MKSLSTIQKKAYNKLKSIGKPTTCKKLGCKIITMQSLKLNGLVNNIQAFGDFEVYGREHELMQWEVI